MKPMQTLQQTVLRILMAGLLAVSAYFVPPSSAASAAKVGAYYFEGWYHDTPGVPAAFATAELRNDFPEREPIWGGGLWRGDTVAIMEQQIDLAADHGIGFFSFDWYWYGNPAATRNDGINSGLKNFMLASNRDRMQFNINIIDAGPTTINSDAEWRQVADMLMPYLADSQYLTVGGNPLVTNFNAAGMTQANFNYFQQAAAATGIHKIEFAANVAGAASIYSHVTRYSAIPGWGAGEIEYPYQSLTEYMEGNDTWAPGFWNTESGGGQGYIPTVMSGFDARPWNTPPSWHFNNPALGHTPAAFGAHLQNAIDWIDANPTLATPDRLVMIYAWNEFGEGGYIAPTVGDPNGLYLDAIRKVVLDNGGGGSCMNPACTTNLDRFETGDINLIATTPGSGAASLTQKHSLTSGYFSDRSRVTEVHLDAGAKIRATLTTTDTDDALKVIIKPDSTGSVTVTYSGATMSNLTAGGRNAIEVELASAPAEGTLFAFAEGDRAWDMVTLPITGPGSYLIRYEDLDRLGNTLDFTAISALGFGIHGSTTTSTRTYEISEVRVVGLGAAQSILIPQPTTLACCILGCLIMSYRRRWSATVSRGSA